MERKRRKHTCNSHAVGVPGGKEEEKTASFEGTVVEDKLQRAELQAHKIAKPTTK